MITTKIIPIGFLSIGIFLLMQVILPLASFQIWEIGQKYNTGLLISPNSPNESQVLGVSIRNTDNFPVIISNLTRESKADYTEFYLSVPRLKMEKTPVLVDSNEISKGLVHLPGAALPGEKGNVFISGHSALNQWFSFQKAPFANLQELKIGDQIVIETGHIKYVYQVTNLKLVDPSDLSVISPSDSVNRFISLMTCWPPGLNFKRLIVSGKMF